MCLGQLRGVSALLALHLVCAVAHAAATSATPTEPFPDLGLLYRSDSNPTVQEVWALGRYHGQYWDTEGSAGADDGYEDRRFRIGGQARLFKNLTLHAQMVSGSDVEPFYNGFTELWAGWRFSDALMLTVGQQKHRFTHDRNVSSRYLNTLERSQLTNMFGADYTPAVTLSGRAGRWSYYGGVFSNATGRDMEQAFTRLDSGYSLLTTVTRDIGDLLPLDSAFLNVSFVHSDANERATNPNRYDQGIASALILTEGPASLITEVTAGLGSDDGDAIGLNLQPGYFVTRRLQVVARYQIAGSNDDSGLTAQRRYEREANMRRGDVYQAGYAGLNFHLAEHRAKLTTGIEYASLDSEHTWTASVAIRVFFGPHARGPFPMAQVLQPQGD
jgi:phosphate-selective porin OprO and OprP